MSSASRDHDSQVQNISRIASHTGYARHVAWVSKTGLAVSDTSEPDAEQAPKKNIKDASVKAIFPQVLFEVLLSRFISAVTDNYTFQQNAPTHPRHCFFEEGCSPWHHQARRRQTHQGPATRRWEEALAKWLMGCSRTQCLAASSDPRRRICRDRSSRCFGTIQWKLGLTAFFLSRLVSLSFHLFPEKFLDQLSTYHADPSPRRRHPRRRG